VASRYALGGISRAAFPPAILVARRPFDYTGISRLGNRSGARETRVFQSETAREAEAALAAEYHRSFSRRTAHFFSSSSNLIGFETLRESSVPGNSVPDRGHVSRRG